MSNRNRGEKDSDDKQLSAGQAHAAQILSQAYGKVQHARQTRWSRC